MNKPKIYIPEPCKEDWSKMPISKNGRFCSVCSKEVMDYTESSHEKIAHSLHHLSLQHDSVCGWFRKDDITTIKPKPITFHVQYKKLTFQQQFLFSVCIAFFLGGFSSCKTVDLAKEEITIEKNVNHSDTLAESSRIEDESEVTGGIEPYIGYETMGGATPDFPPYLPDLPYSITLSSLPHPPFSFAYVLADNIMLFETGSCSLGEKQKNALNDLANKLKKRKKYSLELYGYTDSKGSSKMNKTLSINRAKEVKKYLEKKGIKVKTFKGYGETNPMASNASMVGRKANRRVEIFIRK